MGPVRSGSRRRLPAPRSPMVAPRGRSMTLKRNASTKRPLRNHLQRDPGEGRARIGQGFDDLEVVHAAADVRRRSQLFRKFPRLPCEFGALLFRPSHRYGTADAIGVPDRAVLMLEALVQPHVVVARAQPYWQQVVDAGNKQCTFYNTAFCESAGCQMPAGGMPAQENIF